VSLLSELAADQPLVATSDATLHRMQQQHGTHNTRHKEPLGIPLSASANDKSFIPHSVMAHRPLEHHHDVPSGHAKDPDVCICIITIMIMK
jgi:hypothetical protein